MDDDCGRLEGQCRLISIDHLHRIAAEPFPQRVLGRFSGTAGRGQKIAAVFPTECDGMEYGSLVRQKRTAREGRNFCRFDIGIGYARCVKMADSVDMLHGHLHFRDRWQVGAIWLQQEQRIGTAEVDRQRDSGK